MRQAQWIALAVVAAPLAAAGAKPTVRLGSCYGFQDAMYLFMAKAAFDEGYFDDILPAGGNSAHFAVTLEAANDQCEASESTRLMLPVMLGVGTENGRIHSDSESAAPVIGIAGCECSAATIPVASIGNNFKVPMVSGGATSPDLSDKGLYPYFARVIPPDNMQGAAFAALIAYFRWSRVLSVYPGESYAQGIVSSFKAKLSSAGTRVTVIEYQLPFQSLSTPSDAATFDHEAWRLVVAQVANESPQPRIFFSCGNQLDHELRLFRDVGLVTNHTAWLLSDAVCNMPYLVMIGQDASAWQAADPTDPWWNYPWADMGLFMRGMMCVASSAFGPKYYAPRFQAFLAGATRSKIEAAGWPADSDGWDDAWLTNDFFTGSSYNSMMFESLTPFLYAIGSMLSKGMPIGDIQGDALRDEIFASEFEGITGRIGFDANGDRLAPYVVWNMKVSNGTAFLDAVGLYDGIADNVTWSSKPIFADGTTNVPSDVPAPCLPGTEFADAFLGCVGCPEGKASLSVNSRCVNCTPGYYQNATRQSACLPAPRGFYVAAPGALVPAGCAAGHYAGDRGLTDCSTCSPGTFAAAASMSACALAPPGTVVPAAGARASVACEPGQFSAVEGGQECTPCAGGFAQESAGASLCLRCERGSYAAAESATCTPCAPGMTTESAASSMPTDCQCLAGQYCHGRYPDCECRDCPAGMSCPWGAKEQDLLPYNLSGVPLLVKPHYYTLADDPLSVYLCHPSLDDSRCLGGPPESCRDLFQGLTCASCPAGYAPKGSECDVCSSSNTFVLAIMPILGVIACVIAYYSGNRQVETNTSITLGVSVVFGLLVTLAQLFATFSQLTMPWPTDVGNFFQGTRFLVINPNVISAYCLGTSVLKQYSLRFILPYCIVIAMALCFVVAKVLQSLRCLRRRFFWELPKAINSVFQMYQSIFIALTAIAVVPYQCYSHPNGKSSLIQFPTVVCSTSEHRALIAMSIVLILTFVLPFLGSLIWANVHAMAVRGDFDLSRRHLQMFRFLMYRFRPDVWWWGTPFTIRQLLLAFAPMVQPDDPHSQCIFVIAVLVIYVPLACFFWPWKSDELNLLDTVSMAFVTILVATGSSFMPQSQFGSGHVILMKVVLIILGVVGALLLLYGCHAVLSNGSVSLTGVFGANEKRLKQTEAILNLISDLMALGETLKAAPLEDVVETLLLMNSYDLSAVHRAIAAFQASQMPIQGGSGVLPRRLISVPSSCAAGSQSSITHTNSVDIAEKAVRRSQTSARDGPSSSRNSSAGGSRDPASSRKSSMSSHDSAGFDTVVIPI